MANEQVKKQVIFNTYGGVEPPLILITAVGTVIDIPEEFVPTAPAGCVSVFRGWSATPDGELWKGKITVDKNKTFYAVWAPPIIKEGYEILFKGNGATGTMDSIYAAPGEEITLPPSPDFTHPLNYDFIGWSLESFDPSEFVTKLTMNQNYIVYAIWKLPPGTEDLGSYHKSTGRYVTARPGGQSGGRDYPTYLLPIDSEDSVDLDCFISAKSRFDIRSNIDYHPFLYANQGSGKTNEPKDTLEKDVDLRSKKVPLKYPDLGEDYFYDIYTKSAYFPGSPVLKCDDFVYDLNRVILRNPVLLRVCDYRPIFMPPNKKFKGFAHGFNNKEDETLITEQNTHFNHVDVPVCVYREDDPKYTITIDANDGSGDTAKIENIENEFFWINEELFNLLPPEPGTGMTIRGYSLRPDGEPLFNEGVLIYEDTTLYIIWAYPNENNGSKEVENNV